ncbi:MAG: M28 family peptidase [Anaerolineales bacterium]
MRNLCLTLLTLALVAGCGLAPAAPPQSFSGEQARKLVAEQVDFGPRPPDSPALSRTRAWIESALEAAGWDSRRQSFEYQGVELVNVIGSGGASGPLIVLGAHYDTRPMADQDPDNPKDPVMGAIDGASGVAVLLELARVVPRLSLTCRVELAFFDGEDSGGLNGWEWIVGSTHYAASLGEDPDAVVIVDMVGDRSLRLPRELNSDSELQAEIWGVAGELGYQESFVDQGGYSMMDDHTPFLRRGWPAVDIIDFDYPAWHTTNDVLDQVSADNLQIVGRTLQEWLQRRCG